MELGGQPKPRTAKNMGDKKVTSANVVVTSTQLDVIALNGQHTLAYCVPLKVVSQLVLGPCLPVQIQVNTIYKIQSVNLLDGMLLDRRWPTFTTSFPRRNSHFQRPTMRHTSPQHIICIYKYLSFTQGEDNDIMLSQLGLKNSNSQNS